MFDPPATRNVHRVPLPATGNVHRAQLLRMAALAQHGLDIDEPADFWYRQGIREAFAYAAALLVAGRVADVTQGAADRVVDLLGDGVADLRVLMEATEAGPGPGSGLTWMGQISFDRVTARQPGTDHDLGSQWGNRHDIRICHRRPHDGTVGLLYAYDQTWDEYAILDPAAHVDVVARTIHAALDVDPHLPLTDFLALLRTNATTMAAHPHSPGVRL